MPLDRHTLQQPHLAYQPHSRPSPVTHMTRHAQTSAGPSHPRSLPTESKASRSDSALDLSSNTSKAPSSNGLPNRRRDPTSRTPEPSAGPSKQSSPQPATMPDDAYLDLSHPRHSSTSTQIQPKLLVVDLNGTLVYRPKSFNRNAHPRPYLKCFLEYIFGMGGSADGKRCWEVFVWSSAQPHNVRAMVDQTFGTMWTDGVWGPESDKSHRDRKHGVEGRLLGAWARDTLGLTEAEYRHKVQTRKDLRVLFAHLRAFDATLPVYDERTTVLLDDSPLKAIYQPWNQLILPEFDQPEFANGRDALRRIYRDDRSLDPKTIQMRIIDDDCVDMYLLAVIGILETLGREVNVSAWIRSGGLTLNERREDSLLDPHHLPSHQEFAHWYADPKARRHWIEEGKKALDRRGIEVDSGISLDRQSPEPPMRRARKAWSPSQPADGGPSASPSMSPPPQRAGSPSTLEKLHINADDHGERESSTLRPLDVARYLESVADRKHLDAFDRQQVLAVSDILRKLSRSDPQFKSEEVNGDPNEIDIGDVTTNETIIPRMATSYPLSSNPPIHGTNSTSTINGPDMCSSNTPRYLPPLADLVEPSLNGKARIRALSTLLGTDTQTETSARRKQEERAMSKRETKKAKKAKAAAAMQQQVKSLRNGDAAGGSQSAPHQGMPRKSAGEPLATAVDGPSLQNPSAPGIKKRKPRHDRKRKALEAAEQSTTQVGPVEDDAEAVEVMTDKREKKRPRH